MVTFYYMLTVMYPDNVLNKTPVLFCSGKPKMDILNTSVVFSHRERTSHQKNFTAVGVFCVCVSDIVITCTVVDETQVFICMITINIAGTDIL